MAKENDSLEARIASVFAETAHSAHIPVLIREVEEAAGEAEEAAKDARKSALSPQLVGKELLAARAEMNEAEFTRDRLNAAALRLAERLKELKMQETSRNLAEERDAVLAKRSRLIAALEKNSTALIDVAKIVAQIVECDRAAGSVNARGGIGFVHPVLADSSQFVQKLFEDLLVMDAFAAAARRIPIAA